MAVTRKTQKDIGNYEAKLIGPLTSRQCIFLGIGLVPTCVVGYIVGSTGADPATIFLICAFIIAPFVFLSFAHPYGMKPEVFLKEYYIYHIAAPKKRLYQTITRIDEMKDSPSQDNSKSSKNNKPVHKKDPDYPDFL